MPDFGIFRGFNSKLFSDKLYAGQLPTQLGLIGSINLLPYLLDLFPNASAAYSLRRLNSAYTSNLIRVRRSSDNTEQDIGFTATGNLDTTALTTFCGSGNGFVTTWYDQSGNGRNATQTTAANQPQIVSSGNILTENNKPSVQFDGTNDNLISNVVNTDIFSNSSLFSALKIATQTNEDIPFGFGETNSTAKVRVLYSSSLKKLGFATWSVDYVSTIDTISTNLYLYSVVQNGQNITLRKNNINASGTLPSIPLNTTTGAYSIGSLYGSLISSYYTQMNASEFIFYGNDQSSNRSGIESNINSYYGIY